MQGAPFAMLTKMQGNSPSEFEGFIPDLIEALSRRLRFNYRFYASPDGKYGSLDSATGQWNGMIGECVKNEVGNGHSNVVRIIE